VQVVAAYYHIFNTFIFFFAVKPVSTLSHETDLADIKVEDDIEALDEFLGSDDHIEAIRGEQGIYCMS